MKISISSILYAPESWFRTRDLLMTLDDPAIGVEVFPYFQLTRFEKELKDNLDWLENRYITFHSQYQATDPCYEKGTPEYDVSMKYYQKVFEYSRLLNAGYIVFHYYNFHFAQYERDRKLAAAEVTLSEAIRMSKEYGVRLCIENTEITRGENNCHMFTQNEFISNAKLQNDCSILIDIGHANCAGWDLGKVIFELKDKILGYHLHNNDGYRDSHVSISDGTIDMDNFMKNYCRYTPNADLTIEYAPNKDLDLKVPEDVEFLKKKYQEYHG